MPVVTARFASKCRSCHQPIVAGERIDFSRLNGARHLACVRDGELDPEEEIVAEYRAARACGVYDEQAFDICVEAFGYVPTVKALYGVSDHAKRKEDAYQAHVQANRERSRARRSGYRIG